MLIRLLRSLAALALVAGFAGSAAASQIGFVYALQQVNNGANQIYGFRFDPSTGALTLLPGFPVSSGGTGTFTTVSEQLAYGDGRLYVLNDGADTMTAFSVNRSTGALTAMPFKPLALGAGAWACVAVHPSGSPVVVGNASGGLSSFVVTDTAATAAPGSPFNTGTARPFSCHFNPNGTFVYTGGSGIATSIAGFFVGASTGVLTTLAGSPFESGSNNPRGYASDSSGRLFSAFFNVPHVRAFSTAAAGVPTAVSGNPFASGLTNGVSGVLHPGGFYLVADQGGNRVGSYQVAGAGAGTTLTAVSGSPFAAGGTDTRALALAPDGAHLVAAHGTSRNLTVFQVNPGTGALTTVGVQAANTLGTTGVVTGLVFAPGEAGFVYTLRDVSGGANQIHGFRINPSTGALTLLAGFPIDSGGTGSGIGVSEQMAYLNGRVYVVNDGSNTLTAFKVNRTTGALTALAFSPIALEPGDSTCVAVHPSGSPVVVGNGGGGLSSFTVGAATATAAAGSPFSTGSARPFSCGFSRDGNFVYTGGNVGTEIAGFSVDAGNGILTPLAGSPFDSGGAHPVGYVPDTSGRVYSVMVGASHVRAFTTSAGVPTGVSGNPFTSGLTSGVHGVRHPSGFYIAADRAANRVGVYRISGSGDATTLTPVSGSPFASGGSFTVTSALTEDGAFLVVANGSSRNVTVFQVNPATGTLTFVGVQAANTLGATGGVSGVAFAAVAPPFIDDPLTALTSVIKAVHITELRTRIDAVRAQFGLGPFSYADPALAIGTTIVRAAHVSDLRAALADVYGAIGATQPSYTDPILTIGTTVAKLAHIMQLRAAVVAIE